LLIANFNQGGNKVTEKQPLVVVEAMKMETRITSSMAGIVSSVNIKEGQQEGRRAPYC